MTDAYARLRKIAADKLKGGLADKKPASLFDSKSLQTGTEIEFEHTNNKAVAREISKDHLSEDKDYYKKLRKYVEKNAIDWRFLAKYIHSFGNRMPTMSREAEIEASRRLGELVSRQNLAGLQTITRMSGAPSESALQQLGRFHDNRLAASGLANNVYYTRFMERMRDPIGVSPAANEPLRHIFPPDVSNVMPVSADKIPYMFKVSVDLNEFQADVERHHKESCAKLKKKDPSTYLRMRMRGNG